MPRKRRKIGFYFLTINRDDIQASEALNTIIELINEYDKTDRNKVIRGNKFGLLDSINSNTSRTNHRLLFKSATHSFRPSLIDRDTVEERDSPKTMSEGETQKTHLIVKIIGSEVVLISEKHQNGLTIKQIVNYFNKFTDSEDENRNFHFSWEVIAKDDFLEELDSLSRVVSADVFVDKQLLGGSALNYSDRINSVQHEVIVSVKAKKMDSIADFTRDIFSKLNGGENRVNRIRVIGRNRDNNEVKINTDFIEKQEYVFIDVNDVTGEIVTRDLFDEMENISQNYR